MTSFHFSLLTGLFKLELYLQVEAILLGGGGRRSPKLFSPRGIK